MDALKDHQLAALVNTLRDIAVEYHGTQQLRERIARSVRAALHSDAAQAPIDKQEALRLIKQLRGQSPIYDGAELVADIGPTHLEQEAASFIESMLYAAPVAPQAAGDAAQGAQISFDQPALPSPDAQCEAQYGGQVITYHSDEQIIRYAEECVEAAIAAHTSRAAPVAPAAAAINLEGLRKKLLTPRKILRDEQGWCWHPDYPICDEGTHADKFLEALGIEPAFVDMESDLPDFAERYHEEGLTDCTEWTPTPPAGEGWLLLAIYDTEDGPCAIFGRDQYEAENAMKRKRTQLLREHFANRATTDGAAQ